MNIIQHHGPIDFEALFNQLKDAYIGIDKRDWEVFSAYADEIHSFFGSAESKNRASDALANAIGSDEAEEIVNKCKTFMLIIRYNPEGERPVMMDELSAINEFVSRLPENSDIQWSLMQDPTLGNKVEVVLFCNIIR